MRTVRLSAFTLMELLTVVAIIGILAALLFPGVQAARASANRARTKVQFNQWAAAIEAFRGEYGFYPAFDSTALVNGGADRVIEGNHPFHDILAGRKRDGSVLPANGTAAAQNRNLIGYYSFGESDLGPAGSPSAHLLRDAFDNTEIAVLVDRNFDGVIRIGSDYPVLPAVAGMIPSTADFPANGVRAGVLFYAPAPAADRTNPGFILSWK